MKSILAAQDPVLAGLIECETKRQQDSISLIASENYVDSAILEATASVLTNKYAEGYPGRRYYAGCEIVDQIELLAQERCKQLFHAEHVNVQPHAGSQANMAAYAALVQPGDTIMGMSLAHGGHLTHGHPVNFSGRLYKVVFYTVDRGTEQLDYKEIARLAQEHKPKLIIAGASAYSRIIDFATFAQIAKSVGAFFMADIAHIAGLIAAKLHPSPIPHADVITSTTHKTLRGPRGGLIMSTNNVADLVDRAIIPGNQGGPFMHVIAAKAAAFYQALQPSFVEYQQQIIGNAQALARALQNRGYRIVAGGTDNHLFIIDLQQKMTGLQAEHALEIAGITASRSCIPFDPQKPWVTSGIRFGTPAATTRGMKKSDMSQLAEWIDDALQNSENQKVLTEIAAKVKNFCSHFPLPAELLRN
jgi:glycine hydroxymethyltransferase